MVLKGTVRGVFLASEAKKRMISVGEARAIAGIGLAGDRYAKGVGSYSNATGANLKVRQISFIQREMIQLANRETEVPFEAVDTRRNVETEGIELEQLIGQYFSVGETLMYGTKMCDPCKIPSNVSGKKGFLEAFRGYRGGIRAQILTGGDIWVGAEIRIYVLGSKRRLAPGWSAFMSR